MGVPELQFWIFAAAIVVEVLTLCVAFVTAQVRVLVVGALISLVLMAIAFGLFFTY